MSDKDQAQADLPEDETTVVDPLEDITSNPTPGLEELDEYQSIVNSALETPAEEVEQGDKPAEQTGEEEATEEQSEEENEENTAEVIEQETEESSREEESKPNRFRIRAKDELEAEALDLRKRHPDWSLEECLNKAKTILGVDQQQASQEQSAASQPPVETVASITQQINELTAKKADAMRSMEFEEVATIDAELEGLRDKREGLRIDEVQAKARQEQSQLEAFERAYTESERKAVTFYPDTAKADSEMVKRMIEIDRAMRDMGDPIYHSPDKPFILAKQAASELGIPMARPAATGTQKTSTAPKSPIKPASGNARTTPAAPAPKLEERLQEVDSEEAYEELVTGLTRRA